MSTIDLPNLPPSAARQLQFAVLLLHAAAIGGNRGAIGGGNRGQAIFEAANITLPVPNGTVEF